MKRRSFVAGLAALSLLATGLLSGCGGGETNTANNSPDEQKYGDTYPIESDTTLTYWVDFLYQSTSGVTNFADLPFYKAVKEKTGINVEFTHPSSSEQNLSLIHI